TTIAASGEVRILDLAVATVAALSCVRGEGAVADGGRTAGDVQAAAGAVAAVACRRPASPHDGKGRIAMATLGDVVLEGATFHCQRPACVDAAAPGHAGPGILERGSPVQRVGGVVLYDHAAQGQIALVVDGTPVSVEGLVRVARGHKVAPLQSQVLQR